MHRGLPDEQPNYRIEATVPAFVDGADTLCFTCQGDQLADTCPFPQFND